MLPSRRSQMPFPGQLPGKGRRVLSEETLLPLASRSGRFDRALIAETGVIPAGYQLIQDTFPFEVIDKKEVVVEDANGRELPIMRVAGLIQMGDSENANGRFYPTKEVLIPAVKNVQEDIGKRAVMGEFDHPCVCLSTNEQMFKVLTVDGWKSFDEIRVGDYVWSRLNGRMVKSKVNSIVNEPYNGTAYRVTGRNVSVEFTPGHRFLLERRPDRSDLNQLYATVADVAANRHKFGHCRVPTTAVYDAEPSATVTIPAADPADLRQRPEFYKGDVAQDLVLNALDFASFVGLYLAEGSVQNNTVQIYQISTAGRKLIDDLLQQLGLPYSENERGFYITDKRLADYLRPLGDKYTKYIPTAIKALDAKCLEALVYWFAVGDGRMLVASGRGQRCLSHKHTLAEATATCSLDLGKYSRLSVFTVSKQLIQDLHECVVKAGLSGRLSEVVTEDDYLFAGRTIKADNKVVLYQLHISRSKGFTLDPRFISIEPFHHTGRIYCLSVDHGNFYMEHRGIAYWTGNSDAKIHLDRVSHLMTKVWMDGRKVFGEAEVLHKLPCGACLRGLFEHKVRVGISSRGVGDMEVVEHNGHEVYRVMPGYAFVTWDTVAEPSVNGAILNIQESLIKRLRPLKEQKHLFSPQVYQNMLVREINDFFGLDKRKTFPVR